MTSRASKRPSTLTMSLPRKLRTLLVLWSASASNADLLTYAHMQDISRLDQRRCTR